MSVKEADVGITETLGSHTPFRAIVKQHVQDFVVNEVLLSGQVAKLTKFPQLSHATSLGKRARDDTNECAADPQSCPLAQLDPTRIPFDEIESVYQENVGNTASHDLRRLVSANENQLVLPVCNEKHKRTIIHRWVREHIPVYNTDTVEVEADGEKGKAVRLLKKSLCRSSKRMRTDRPTSDRLANNNTNGNTSSQKTEDSRKVTDWQLSSSFNRPGSQIGRSTMVSFVLWKRNMDTTTAINALTKALRVPSSAFSYSGTKDKRAVTTQLVQIRGITEDRLARANALLSKRDRRFPSIRVGNYKILPKGSNRPLKLGDLRGNRFTIVLRDLELGCQADEANIGNAVAGLKARGFVNYFGLQRFGTGVSGTHATGFAILRGDFEDACRRILLPVPVVDKSLNEQGDLTPARRELINALKSFARKELTAQDLLKSLPKWMHIERTIASSFASDERRGVQKYDYKAAFSKLPRNLRRMYGHAVQSYIWNMMASERIRMNRPSDPSRMHAIEGDLIPVNEDDAGELSFDTMVREVTSEEEEQKSISVFRVLIPVVGSDVSIPNKAEYGKVAAKIIEEEKMELSGNLVREFGMKGTYRFLLAAPRDVEMRIASYVDSSDVLTPEAHLPEDCSGEKQVRIGGATEEKDEDASLHCEALDGTGNEVNMNTNEAFERAETTCANRTNTKGSIGADAGFGSNKLMKKKALVIEFTLGRGEFATMVIRELTLMDSSTANQKEMQANVDREMEAAETLQS